MEQKGLAPILIVVLIALVVGGYILLQKQSKPVSISLPSPSPAISPQSVPQPASEQNPFPSAAPGIITSEDSLNIYTNESFKLQIKYSRDWSFSENLKPTLGTGGIVNFSKDGSSLSIFPFEAGYGVAGDGDNIIKIKETRTAIKIGQYTTDKIAWGLEDKILEEHATLKIGKTNFFFLMQYKNGIFNQNISDAFNNILSTFKFTQ